METDKIKSVATTVSQTTGYFLLETIVREDYTKSSTHGTIAIASS